jgi:hypothetical protein
MYMQRSQTRIDARKSELLPSLMDEVITEASLFREIEALTEDFASALESLLEVIKIYHEDATTPEPHEFRVIGADLRGLVSDLRRKAKEVPDTLAHHLKFLELRRNVQESSGLWVLTVLASLFLPLSLACGILSMQTRLKDLNLLLYDFCGVAVLLVTLAALLLLFVRLSMGIREWLKTTASSWSPFATKCLIFVSALLVFQSWGAVLASFVIGMTKDVRIGGIILGSAIAYFAISAGIICLCFRFIWKLFKPIENC